MRRHGYKVVHGHTAEPGDKDIFVTWNRIAIGHSIGKAFQKAERPVLVVENATWGNTFAGEHWYHIARDFHNTSGCFDVGDNDRWDSLDVSLPDFRAHGETVILPQRGIGSKPVAMPDGWARKALKQYGGRIRPHPGMRDHNPLDVDLSNAGRVITWGSGAAVKALMIGIPVISEMPNWIAEQDNTIAGRLDMFRRLAWAQWRHEEIAKGIAFEYLIHG